MAAQYSVPLRLADLLPRPAPFDASKHGTHVKFSEEYSVAKRVKFNNNGVVYTVQPVPVGKVWRITVLDTTSKPVRWGGGLSIGLTTKLPEEVPPEQRDAEAEAGPQEWIWESSLIYHNNETYSAPCRLKDLTAGQSVGFLVTPSGQLHVYLDDKHHSEVATGVPVDTPLWGMADVYGRCAKIKSEMMSGKKTPDSPTEAKNHQT